MTDTQAHVRFLFDPACPWSWRTSQWVRNVAQVRPLQIEWDLLSLQYINRDNQEQSEAYRVKGEQRIPLMRLLELVRQQDNEVLNQMYVALGQAVHEGDAKLEDETTWKTALSAVGLPDDLLDQAYTSEHLDAELVRRYDQALDGGAIGTPTLYFNGGDAPFYGPVIDSVPSGEEAGELWDRLSWIATRPYFYELKRGRT